MLTGKIHLANYSYTNNCNLIHSVIFFSPCKGVFLKHNLSAHAVCWILIHYNCTHKIGWRDFKSKCLFSKFQEVSWRKGLRKEYNTVLFVSVFQAEAVLACYKSHSSVQRRMCQQVWSISGQVWGLDKASLLISLIFRRVHCTTFLQDC